MPDFSPFFDPSVQDLLNAQLATDDADGSLQHNISLANEPATPVSSVSTYGSAKGVQLPGQHISTAFNSTISRDPSSADTILLSSDGTLFTVHRRTVLASSSNHLNGLLPDEYVDLQDNAALSVPETASTLNILLHVLYNISCARYQPSFACLSDTTAVLRKYGLKPASVLARGQPLYNALLFIAPLNPIETYALAASEGLEDLAVAVSSYTLGMKPYDHLTPELVEAMGALYLHRLMNLHGKRLDGLRELLEAKIFSHAATPHCSAMDQQVVSKAFELAAAQIFYDATPALPQTTIETVFNGLIKGIRCPDCQQAVQTQVDTIVIKWALFERTI